MVTVQSRRCRLPGTSSAQQPVPHGSSAHDQAPKRHVGAIEVSSYPIDPVVGFVCPGSEKTLWFETASAVVDNP